MFIHLKHEVRFHQSRYVHDFIYSVCHKALTSALAGEDLFITADNDLALAPEQSYSLVRCKFLDKIATHQQLLAVNDTQYVRPDYIQTITTC